MSDHIGKELAAREIAKALSKLSLEELKKVAAKYEVDITEALDGEYFTKADRAGDDEAENLTDLAKRIGNHPVIEAAKKLDALSTRLDAMDGLNDSALARLQALVDQQTAIRKRAEEDAAMVAEWKATGRYPPAFWSRQAEGLGR
jgi:hypothetical protein